MGYQDPTEIGGSAQAFLTTHWTLIGKIQTDQDEDRAPIGLMLERYSTGRPGAAAAARVQSASACSYSSRRKWKEPRSSRLAACDRSIASALRHCVAAASRSPPMCGRPRCFAASGSAMAI